MNKITYFSSTFRLWSLLFAGIFSITLSFATNPVVPNEDPDPCKNDREAPYIDCPEDIYVYADCDDECVRVKFREPRAKDNCDPRPKVWCEYQSGYCFPVGRTEVWCWAKDKSGNESKHSFNVYVKQKPDKEAPRLHCPKDIVAYVDCGEKCTKVDFHEPEADDNCDPRPKVWCEYQSDYCYPIGKTEVWCWAKDKSGNESKCYFTVTVCERPDEKAPEITCIKDLTFSIDCRSSDKCVSVKFDVPKAKDNCDPNPSVKCNYASGYCFPIGTTKVTCTARDKSGNESSCSFNVIVKANDTKAPVITCPKDMDLYTECVTTCTRMIWWMDAEAKDDCDPNPTIWYEVGGKVITKLYCFPVGSNTVTAYAQDNAGNKSSCTYKVNVKFKPDFTPPVITCPKDVMYSLSDEQTKLNKMCRTVVLPTVTATDNCGPATVVCTINNGGSNITVTKDICFMLGKTRVTCTATDGAGNTSSCGFWVTIMAYGDKIAEVNENNTAVAGPKNRMQEGEKNVTINGEVTPTDLNLSSTQRLLRKEFAVYPNPTNGLVNLDLAQYDGKNVAVQVLNSVGQQVYNLPIKEVTNQTYSVDMQNYPTGIYLVKVTSNGVETISRKIMKQ